MGRRNGPQFVDDRSAADVGETADEAARLQRQLERKLVGLRLHAAHDAVAAETPVGPSAFGPAKK